MPRLLKLFLPLIPIILTILVIVSIPDLSGCELEKKLRCDQALPLILEILRTFSSPASRWTMVLSFILSTFWVVAIITSKLKKSWILATLITLSFSLFILNSLTSCSINIAC